MRVRIDFYDELEMLVASRKPCEIVFMKDGGRSVVNGIISDLPDSQEYPFLRMDSGLEIRFENLIEVNGKRHPNIC